MNPARTEGERFRAGRSGAIGARVRSWFCRLFGRADRALDGEIVRLGPDDRLALVLHQAALAPEDRRARFNGRVKIRALLQMYRDRQAGQGIGLGIFDRDRLVALREMFPQDDGTHAEIALSVRKAWQRRQYGRRLLREALAIAQAGGYLPYMVTNRENRRLIALAISEGGVMESGAGEIVIRFPEISDGRVPIAASCSAPAAGSRSGQ